MTVSHWKLVFEAIDMCLLRRRETNSEMIFAFVKVLLLNCTHAGGSGPLVTNNTPPGSSDASPNPSNENSSEMGPVNTNWVYTSKTKKNRKTNGGQLNENKSTSTTNTSSANVSDNVRVVLLNLVHNIMLRYPKTRTDFTDYYHKHIHKSSDNSGNGGNCRSQIEEEEEEDDDMVCDLAMKALKKDTARMTHNVASISNHNLTTLYDGVTKKQVAEMAVSLRKHDDKRVRYVVDALVSRDVIPVPLNFNL